MANGGGGSGSGGPVSNPPVYVFTSPDVLTTTDNALIPWLPGRGGTISLARAQVKTAPTGADIHVDLVIGLRSSPGVLVPFTTVVIPAGSFSVDFSFVTTSLDTSHFLGAQISQIGSGVAGSNLTIEVS